MTHQDLLSITLSVHAAVLLGALAAWYKYGDRSDVLARSLGGTEKILSTLRMMISRDLTAAIKTVLATVSSNPSPILGPDGKNSTYSEKASNFLESESFRQAVRDYIDFGADAISDYRLLMRARTIWCLWARVLRWSILTLIILQGLFLCGHSFVDWVLGKSMPDWCFHASLSITGFLVLFVFCLPFPLMLRSHDIIIQQKVKYDAP